MKISQRVLSSSAVRRCHKVQMGVRVILVSFILSVGGWSSVLGQVDTGEGSVTPAEGPSVLARMGLRMDDSSLGRNGLLMSRMPRGGVDSVASSPVGLWLTRGFALDGADLYRINCRACHRAGGEGLPPEVSAILDPVRASSPGQIKENMAKRGRSISPAMAERMASRAELALRHRLSEGGETMASFDHLEPAEVEALLGYLEFLADVPSNTADGPAVHLSAVRVGEHVIKAVCHVCHDAQRGPRRGIDAELPSLREITHNYSIAEVVHKVRSGKIGAQRTRGRMPRFTYLSEEEIAAAYVYLAGFPPRSPR